MSVKYSFIKIYSVSVKVTFAVASSVLTLLLVEKKKWQDDRTAFVCDI